MIVDVEYNNLQKMSMKSGNFFMYDGVNVIELYYINKGPVVFRSIIKKDENLLGFMTSLKEVIPILNPIKEDTLKEQLVRINDRVESILRFLKIGR